MVITKVVNISNQTPKSKSAATKRIVEGYSAGAQNLQDSGEMFSFGPRPEVLRCQVLCNPAAAQLVLGSTQLEGFDERAFRQNLIVELVDAEHFLSSGTDNADMSKLTSPLYIRWPV